MPIINDDRLDCFEVGTVMIENGDRDFVIVFDNRSVFRGDTIACIYADPNTHLAISTLPSHVDPVIVHGRKETIAAVSALPPGSIFIETDGIGRRHRFIKVWDGNVIIDNGGHKVTAYAGVDETASIKIETIPR